MKQPQRLTFSGLKTTPTHVASWAHELNQLHRRIASRFARPEPRRRALAYLPGLLSSAERKNGWQRAEQARDARPYGMQRLLSQAVWDTDGVRDDLRCYALEQLGTQRAVVAIDETSFPKRGKHSAGVQVLSRLQQAQVPMAWVVADTVYGSNLDLRTWLEDHGYPYVLAVRCDESVGIVTPDGRSRRVIVAEVEALLLPEQDWQRLSMSEGTKGPRLFDWAAVPILHRWETDGRHWLLRRRCLSAEQQKTYYLVSAPPGTTLPQMVQAIGARWHIEEDFENGKDLGLDHYEVRSYLDWYRHVTLVMLALAWSWWRRCHRSCACFFHTKRRLEAG